MRNSLKKIPQLYKKNLVFFIAILFEYFVPKLSYYTMEEEKTSKSMLSNQDSYSMRTDMNIIERDNRVSKKRHDRSSRNH